MRCYYRKIFDNNLYNIYDYDYSKFVKLTVCSFQQSWLARSINYNSSSGVPISTWLISDKDVEEKIGSKTIIYY